MKVILTEEQYKILESIINEVSSGNFTNAIEVGSTIKIIKSNGDSEELKVTKLLDNDKFIEANDGSQKHIVVLDSAFYPENNTFTSIKRGTYVPGTRKKKSQVIVGGGQQQTIKDVSRVEIYNPNGKKIDTTYTKLGEKDKEKSDVDREEKLNKRLDFERKLDKKLSDKEREIYNMVLNNPTLKKAFYHQPKLLGGLLNFGKAKGIGPAQNLIKKYVKDFREKGEERDTEFKDFKVNSNVSFELLNKPITLSNGDKQLRLDVGGVYPARTQSNKQYLKGHTGSAEDKVGFKIYMKEKSGDDIYSGTIKAYFKEKGTDRIVDKMDNVIIKIRDYNY